MTATASLDSLVPKVPKPLAGKIDFLKLTNVAIAGGASDGGAAVVGAFIVDIFNLSTRAWIADGAQINQEGRLGGAGQNVTVAASDSITIDNVGGALALSKSSAGCRHHCRRRDLELRRASLDRRQRRGARGRLRRGEGRFE